MHAPQEIHWHGTLDLLAYLEHALGRRLFYQCHRYLKVEAYYYSNYACDHSDQKFTLGYYIYVGANLVTWTTHQQWVISLSNAKAEFCVMAQTSSEMLWVRSLLRELSFPVQGAMPMILPFFLPTTLHFKSERNTLKLIVMLVSIASLLALSQLHMFAPLISWPTYFLKTELKRYFITQVGHVDIYAPA